MSEARQAAEILDALAEDYVERLRRGETPEIDSYVAEHPRLEKRIRSLFPLLSVIEGVGRSGQDATPVSPDHVAARAPPAAMPERIGCYRIVGSLGQGGMGRVFRAVRDDAAPDAAHVAIKVIHPHLVGDAGCLARFLREAEAGRRIRHHNVVRTLEAGVVDLAGVEAPFLVLEYVEGQTLRALLDEVGRVPERLCRHVGRRVAAALAAIHAQGIVHRDIKPANVLITADETVKVMDLGVALLQDEALRLSGTGEFVGSLLYAAPEQLDGRRPDPRTDLYALGLTLHELAAGRLPQRRGDADPVASLPHASPFFSAVVESLLARDPDARPPTAARLHDMLGAGERSAWWRRRDVGRPSTPAWIRSGHLTGGPALQGRERELEALDDAYGRAQAGDGCTVFIEGEAGIGKSRLVAEWLERRERAQTNLRAVVVRHAPGTEIAATPPLAEALVSAFGLKRVQEWIAEALDAGSPLAQALAQQVSGGSGLALPLPSTSLATAWLRLLRAIARAAPLVLVFEDLHFADRESRQLFVGLARGLRRDPLLLLGTTRPQRDGEPGLDEVGNVTSLHLPGLSNSSCRALLRAAYGERRPLADEATLIRKSDGNPFFLLEMVRALGDLATDAEAPNAATATGIPSTVRSIIERRLARLTEQQRELLEAGACCGFAFDPTVVAKAARIPLLGALKRFARLERTTDLLRATGKNYAFRHHLVQEVLYEDTHPRLREAYHAAIGSVLLERQRDAVRGPDAAAVCHHLFAGGRAADGAAFVGPALDFLVSRGAYARAIELARAALEEPDLCTDVQRVETLRLLGSSLQSVSRYDEARVCLEEALGLADAAGSSGHAAHVRRDLGDLLERLADHEGALRMHREATALTEAAGDALEQARARAGLAGVLMRQRHLKQAHEHATACMDLLPAEGHELVELEVVHTLAQIEVRRGHVEDARPLLERASALARRVGSRNREIAVISTLGHLSYRSGRFEAAHTELQRALELASELGDRDDLPHLRINDALCLRYLGRMEEAQDVIELGLAEATAMGHETARIRAQARLGEILLTRGHLGRALEAFREVMGEATRVGDPAAESSAARGLTRVLSGLGEAEEAEAVLDAWLDRVQHSSRDTPVTPIYALTIRGRLRERAGCPEEAIALFEQAWFRRQADGSPLATEALLLGSAYARAGRHDDAREVLTTALELARCSNDAAEETMASIYLGSLPDGDPLAARLLLERHGSALSLVGRVNAHFTLWKTTGEPERLEAAWRCLSELRSHAPVAYRDRMLHRVMLYRAVQDAWQTHGDADIPARSTT